MSKNQIAFRLAVASKPGRFVVMCVFLGFVLTSLTLPTAAQSVYSQAYTFSTLAGSSSTGTADGVGSNARFDQPTGIAVDQFGNLYVADTYNQTIRKTTAAGVVSTIAGFAGSAGSADGAGSAARFYFPHGMAVDNQGNVYVSDAGNHTIRRLQPVDTNWLTTTIAGQAGNPGGTDATGTNAQFNSPAGIAVDGAGNLYVADAGNATIREISPTGGNWVVTTISGQAGNPGVAYGVGTNAQYELPYGIAVDNSGNLFVADQDANLIQEITLVGNQWVSANVAGGTEGYLDATGSSAEFYFPDSIAVDATGNLYVAEYFNETIRKITLTGSDWVVTTLAGNNQCFSCSSDGTGTNANFQSPSAVTVDAQGDVFAADRYNNTIRRVTSGGVVSTLAGEPATFGGADGTGTAAQFFDPDAVAVDTNGNIYVADRQNRTIRKVTPAGVVSTVAGLAGNYGEADGTGSYARFSSPMGVAVDTAGNVYVTDFVSLGGGSTIRKITPGGVVTTIETGLLEPTGIAADGLGNLFFTDQSLRAVYELSPVGASWNLTYLTGQIYQPTGIAVDRAGNIYVADPGTSSIQAISFVGGRWMASVIAGGASAGSADGAGTNAQFEFPFGLAVDSAGNLYVSDYGTETIRKITPVGTNWIVSTIGGLTGQGGGTDGLGRAARFYDPDGVAVDASGIVYVADSYNNSIRKGVFSQFTPSVQIPFTPPTATGQLVVTLLPPEANGQWRFPWELAWRNSGTAATNLVAGVYPVEFRDTPGYVSIPPSNSVNVTAEITLLTNYYYPTVTTTDTNIDSSLTVNIQPSLLAGAGWRLLGDTNSFYPPGYTTNLLGGTYLVEFATVAGFATPGTLSVQVAPGAPTVVSTTYSLAQSPPAGVNLPAPVLSANIGDLANYPYGFNGQLQTDVGYGSGVAVQTNIVLTAAHLVFADQTLSYVNDAWWFYQEEAGVFTPEPISARGWYVLSGYAAQRTNDQLGGLGPDQSSPQSRNFDVAALYFESQVANGGYGGWLPSDDTPNPWLTGTAEKLLVGYPVDGSGFGIANIVNGEMYEIGPQPYPLSIAPDPVNDQQVYTASWFLSYPGNSGGPLYVQLNGYYYPAGVYLGTLFNGIVPYASAVRAIDSNVVSLITLAAALGDGGSNYLGGGVITIIPSRNTSRSNPGYLILQLGPPAAVQVGAAWKLTNQSDAFYSTANPSVQEVTSTNSLTLQFRSVAGWNLPTNRSVTVTPGLIVTNLAFYTVTNPLLRADAINGLVLNGTANTTYQIQTNCTLCPDTWFPFKTNVLNSSGSALITNRPAPGFYRALWLSNSP